MEIADNKKSSRKYPTAFYYRLIFNLIAGRLLFSRACFLFGLITQSSLLKSTKSPTIFDYITNNLEKEKAQP
jgi:hypothetical protein